MIDFSKYKNLNQRIANDLERSVDENTALMASMLKNVTEAVVNGLVKEKIIANNSEVVNKTGSLILEEFINGLDKIL